MLPQEFKPTLDVQLDWRAYFAAFRAAHGEPVPFDGRWLFPDGWTYAWADHAGPEWPPDPGKLDYLRLAYWRARKKIALDELNHLQGRLNWLRGMQQAKSVPLKERKRYPSEREDGTPCTVSEVKDLNLRDLEERLEWLKGDVANADLMLKEAGDENEPTIPANAEPVREGA